ncbi:MAG: DUF4340 domain-containing protein [Acidobacteriota bacterium]|nr:DUF4340 domain-containing protein [Acidobacteriota bacterium]
MKPRNLLIAAVVLAALSGAVWYSKRHPPSTGAPTAATPKLVDIPEKDIQSVDLKKKDGSTLTLQRQAGKWTITAPEQWRADQDAATSLSSALNPVSADSVVEDKASDLAKYGLNSPSLTVTVHRTNGKSDQVAFGDDVPAGSLVYAQANGNAKVYAVASSVKTSLDKSASDLRDKRLLTFDTNKLTRVEVASGKSDVEFGKNNQNEWQILKPGPFRADSFQVEELLRKLTDAKMDLSAGAGDDLKKAAAYAAGSPDATVKVSDSTGTQTLEVHKDKDDYYAKSSVVDGAYKVSSDLGKSLAKSLDEFRNKKIFDFGFSDPTKIVLQNGSSEKTLVRSGTDWKINRQTIDPGTVQAFVDKLRDLAATKFVTSGFGTPNITITITSNEGKRTEKAEFAKTSDGYLVRRENESALYGLDAKSVNDTLDAGNAVKPAASTAKK